MQRRRLTFTVWLLWCGVHVAATVVIFSVLAGVRYSLGYSLDRGWWPSAAIVVLFTPVSGFVLALMNVESFNRKIPDHFCKTCGYDLTGNVTGRCSECGGRLDSADPAD